MIPRRKAHTEPPAPTGDRRFTFTISDQDYDVENDRIFVAGWDLAGFQANPTVLANHDHRSFPIARATAIWATRDQLKAELEFPPVGISARADEARGLVERGFLRSTSVGFAPGEYERNARGGIDFVHGHRLLEVSLTGCPANPRALLDEHKMKAWLAGAGVRVPAGPRRAVPAGFGDMNEFLARTELCDADGRPLATREIALDDVIAACRKDQRQRREATMTPDAHWRLAQDAHLAKIQALTMTDAQRTRIREAIAWNNATVAAQARQMGSGTTSGVTASDVRGALREALEQVVDARVRSVMARRVRALAGRLD